MRWGLIARSETDRGLGIQTHAMFEHLQPDKTLVVINRKSGFDSHPENYPGATLVDLHLGPLKSSLDEQTVRDWWQGLDVVVSVETLYDWDLVAWARADGVRTVVHGNPEFWMATNPQPDIWWWPTSWRSAHLPTGPIVPVPVPDVPFVALDPAEGPLKALHVAGNGAMGDRNGTSILAGAMRSIPAGVKLTVCSQVPVPSLRAKLLPPVENRWDMYKGQHLLVLPRRYGGLCLPALEAMASGLAVLMSDCSPNQMWEPVYLMPSDSDRVLTMQTGPVETYACYPNVVANSLKHFNSNREALAQRQAMSREWAERNRWSELAPLYHRLIDDAS
jgi:hypothetical protein